MSVMEQFFEALKEQAEENKRKDPELQGRVESMVARFTFNRLSYRQKRELQHGSKGI